MDHSKVLGVAHVENCVYKLVLLADGNDHVDEATVFVKMPREWKKIFVSFASL